MNKQFNYVNWVNGMKINQNHLIQEQNANIYKLQLQIRSISSTFSYGIFCSTVEDGLIFSKSLNDDICHLNIKKLTGVTPDGSIVQITSGTEFDIEINRGIETEPVREYFVGIKVDLFKKAPIGTVSPNENPPRYPFVLPKYKGIIIPVSEKLIVGGLSNILIIDKIIYKDNQFIFEDNYIPPSFRMSSLQQLRDIWSKIYNQLINIQELIFVINSKIISDPSQTTIAKTTNQLFNGLLWPIGVMITEMQIKKDQISIIQLINGMINLVTHYGKLIRLCKPQDKEEYINYLSSWINLSTGEYISILKKFITHNYDHNQIANSIHMIDDFLTMHESLFKKISELSFIGKKKDTSIFIKEHKSSSNFLLD